MHYQEAETFLLQRELFGWKLGLERMRTFLDELGRPHEQLAMIHIAGTNGKGSVTAMLDSILRESGLKCGMYTSPHLQSLRERIRVAGRWIDESEVVRLVERWRPVIVGLECTFFETMTGLAFRHFADAGVEAAVIEVGLGGRLDATNVITPLISIITNISFDHMDHLGTTLAAIAAEKAGIIKPGVPCLIGALPAEPEGVIAQRAAELGSPLIKAAQQVTVRDLRLRAEGSQFNASAGAEYPGVFLPLPGPHQVGNAEIALCAAEYLAGKGLIPAPPPLQRGLAGVRWAGRFEPVCDKPLVLIDVAHNPGGFAQQNWMWRHFYPGRPKALVLGLVKEKDLSGVIHELPPDIEHIFAVPAPTHRGLPVGELAAALREARLPVSECADVAVGVEAALAWAAGDATRVVCITGSHYTVGAALDRIKSLTK